jgi:hypothetical protein
MLSNLVYGKPGNKFCSEDLLRGEFVDDFRDVKLRMRFQKVSHLPAAFGLPQIVALLGQLDLHVLDNVVDEHS